MRLCAKPEVSRVSARLPLMLRLYIAHIFMLIAQLCHYERQEAAARLILAAPPSFSKCLTRDMSRGPFSDNFASQGICLRFDA